MSETQTVDLRGLVLTVPREGFRSLVYRALGLGRTERPGKWIHLSGAPRRRIGCALSHIRLAGWRLDEEWIRDADPAQIVHVRLGRKDPFLAEFPRRAPRGIKVYRLNETAFLEVAAFIREEAVQRGALATLGFSRRLLFQEIGVWA